MGIIAGIVTTERADGISEIMERMISCQSHRDDALPEFFIRGGVALAMANRHDALHAKPGNGSVGAGFPSDKGDVVALIDGILLDVPEKMKALSLVGEAFPYPRCSQIIEHAYRKWGLDFPAKLEGEFACAIWDSQLQRLVLVRDPYGHKPLHYHVKDESVAFSSEIKGVLAAGVRRSVDLTNLSDFLSLNGVPCPGTIFENIFQVPPGSMVIIEKGSVTTRPYWSHAMDVRDEVSFDDAVDQFSAAVGRAVGKRMVTEDTYCFLSGGIDSSALLSFAAEQSSKPVHAVSVGFSDEEYNELEYAAVMAKHVGAVHHQVVATPDSFLDMLETLVCHHDTPFTDTSAYPTYFAAKLARGFTDTILTGDGPDQMLGGSGHHVFALRNGMFRQKGEFRRYLCKAGVDILKLVTDLPSGSLAAKVKRKLYRDSVSPVHALYDLGSAFPDIAKQYLFTKAFWEIHRRNDPYRHPESWFSEVGNVDDINKYLYADLKFYVTDDLMIKVDRMCMAHGLETLSPFQDVEVGRIAKSLPGNHKIHVDDNGDITTKRLLKEVCKTRFPAQIMNKRKQGFAIPLEKWLRHDNCRFVKEILLDPGALSRGYFEKAAMERLVRFFAAGKGDYFFPNPTGIVALLTLELWHRKYLDDRSSSLG